MKVDSFKGKQTNKKLLYNVDSARFLKKKKKKIRLLCELSPSQSMYALLRAIVSEIFVFGC